MGLHWAAPALKALIPEEMFAQLQTAQVDPHTPTKDVDTLRFLNGRTGEITGGIEVKKFYRFQRGRLRNLLAEGLNIKWGKTLSQITYSDDGGQVTAHLMDGTEDTGSTLVGADGPQSQVRDLLVGSEPTKTVPIGFAATMCFNQLPRDKALFLRSEPFHPLYQCAPHPNGYFAWLGVHDIPDPDDPESWTFFHYISFPESSEASSDKTDKSPAEGVAYQKELAKQFADPFKSAFEWMPKDATQAWYGKLRHWDPEAPGHKWDNHGGRVTLAGDAAHPMTFQRGQGLNHAVLDSLKLCEAIKSCCHAAEGFKVQRRRDTIDEYEKEMVMRSGEEVRLGEINSKMMHDWTRVRESPVLKKGMGMRIQERNEEATP